MSELKTIAKELLESGKVGFIIGYKQERDPRKVVPFIARTPTRTLFSRTYWAILLVGQRTNSSTAGSISLFLRYKIPSSDLAGNIQGQVVG